jgi:hypothetical protein
VYAAAIAKKAMVTAMKTRSAMGVSVVQRSRDVASAL